MLTTALYRARAWLVGEHGQTSVEYGLVVSLAVGLVIALVALNGPVFGFFGRVVAQITSSL
jgi:Flp pilus assembly pilin Flp